MTGVPVLLRCAGATACLAVALAPAPSAAHALEVGAREAGRRVIVWRAGGRGATRLALPLGPPGGGKASGRLRLRVRGR